MHVVILKTKYEISSTPQDTLVFDGKAERSVGVVQEMGEQGVETRFYRAVEPLVGTAGLMRSPCGGCPVVKGWYSMDKKLA